MASYPPPTENLPIFDDIVFRDLGNEPLTYNDAKKYFLTFPSAQGDELLQSATVSGDLTVNGATTLADGVANNMTILETGSVRDLQAYNSFTTLTGTPSVFNGTADFNDAVNINSGLTMNSTPLDMNTNNITNGGSITATNLNGALTSSVATTYNIAGGRIITTNDGAYTSKIRVHPYDTVAVAGGQVSIGSISGDVTQGRASIAIGNNAGQYNQGVEAVAIGLRAGQGSTTAGDFQGDNAVAIGLSAGQNNQGASAVGIGLSAGLTSQGVNAISIGYLAGQNTQLTNSVAIGQNAGNLNQGSSSVAVGSAAGKTTQGNTCVAIGSNAGQNTQSDNSVAIGTSAGLTTQFARAVAVGNLAGQVSQNINSVAVGNSAGRYTQGTNCVAIGNNAGVGTVGGNFQGNGAIAIGNNAGSGSTTGQGANAIAIGTNAGTGAQTANSICLNGSGSAVNPTTAGLYVRPITSVALSSATTTAPLFYNTTTYEISSITSSTLKTAGTLANTAMTSGTIYNYLTAGLTIGIGTYIVEFRINITNTATAGSITFFRTGLSTSTSSFVGGTGILTMNSLYSVPALAGTMIGNATTIFQNTVSQTYYLPIQLNYLLIVPTTDALNSSFSITRIA